MLRTLGYSKSVLPVARAQFGAGVARVGLQRFYSDAPQPNIEEVADLKQFNRLIDNKEKLTVVDFYATWCGPCKAISPIFEALSIRVPEVQFAKVDVDKALDVSREYGITAMPTCLFFQNGEKVDTIVGANVQKLVKLVQDYSGVDIKSR